MLSSDSAERPQSQRRIAGRLRRIMPPNQEEKPFDFASYGETLIKLPDQTSVRVRDARIDHVRHQREQLIKNHMRQMQAFITHHDGYVMLILDAMKSWGFETAGQAIAFFDA